MRGHGLLRRLAGVLPQVESVGNLNCLRGSGADALAIRTGPVPARRLDLGVPLQPGGQRAGHAIEQNVQGPVSAHVHQDGVVRLAAADREVIDAEHLDPVGIWQRLGADEPDQHVTAGRHGELLREP